MDFFNKLGDIANKTYQKTSKKTGEIAKEAKIKVIMSENKSKIKELYIEIGKIVYQKYSNKEEISLKEDVNSYCNQINELSTEIKKLQEEILVLKNKRICENCYAEIALNARYCQHCGFEQEGVIEEEEKIEEKDKDENK